MGVANSIATENRFRFMGTSKPKDPRIGDIFCDIIEGREYVYNNTWICIGDYVEEDYEQQPKLKLKKTICDCCGAKLPVSDYDRNGLVECRFCSTIHQAWEAY